MVAEGEGIIDDLGLGDDDEENKKDEIQEEDHQFGKPDGQKQEKTNENGDSVKAPLVIIDKIEPNHDDSEDVAVRQVTDGNQAKEEQPHLGSAAGMSENPNISPIVDIPGV